MSKSNPFTTAEDGEESSTESNQESSQSGEEEAADTEIAELKKEIQELRGEVKELHDETEPEPPEPEYECDGEECDGFAVEEVEAEHVTTRSPMFKSSKMPETVECPRCGEEMSPDAFVPKEEQQTRFGGKPLQSNSKAAGRTLEQRFEEEGREAVLERAGKE